MIIRTVSETMPCTCGHSWLDHHQGVVMNPKYVSYPLAINNLIAQECEHNQRYGNYFLNEGETKYCRCPGFKPRWLNIQKLVDQWVKTNG